MKTYSNLWDKFISKENFELAYKNSIKGKSKQRQIKEFKKNKDENLEKVRRLVISGKFHTSKYRKMTIYEPKERIIYKLPYNPDRIVQHAVMNILKPILLKKFIQNSYACIEGRGQHKASRKCSEYVRRNEYCLQGDCRKFYPSINHDVLSAMFHRIIKDERFLGLVDDIIYSIEGETNCPIGNYCSQRFGNYYLTKLDNFIKHGLKIRDYVRFCDDFLIFANDKEMLKAYRIRVKDFLKSQNLLDCSKLELFKTRQGVDFCGYRSFGKYVLLRKATAKRAKKRIREFNLNFYKYDNEYVAQSVASTKGVLKHCCSYNLKKSLGIHGM